MAVPDLQDAISHLQQNNADAAITVLEAKIDELPAHLTAHVLLARAYEAKQRWADALTSWENVRFLMPNSPVAREGKERVLRRLGQDDTSSESSPSPTPADSADASPDDTGAPPDDDSSPVPDSAPEGTDSSEAPPSDEESTPTPSTAAASDPATDASPDAPSSPEAPDTASTAPASDASSSEAASDQTDDTEPPSEPDSSERRGPTTAPEAVSELEQLRQKAEEEARKGGARGNRTEKAPSPASEQDETPDPESETDLSDTPEERVREMNEDDDLERLIDELESARIEPNPDVEEVPTPDLDDEVDDIVSETLARIHEAQDEYRKAAQIYVKLASQEPDQARTYLQKASKMRERAEAQNEAQSDDA